MSELARSWPLLGATVLGVAMGATSLISYSAGIMMPAIEREFGWTRGDLSLVFMLFAAALALASPLVGWMTDRAGSRLIIPVSLLAVAALCLMLGRFSGTYASFVAIFIAIGLFGAGATAAVFSRLLCRAFDAAQGRALGIGLVGLGLASMMLPPAMGEIVERHGWRAGYDVLAVAIILATPIVGWVIWRHPASHAARRDSAGPAPAEGRESILSSGLFWHLAAIFGIIQITVSGLVVHIVPLLVSFGEAPTTAAAYASAVGLAMIVARLGTGFLVDHFFAPFVGMAMVTIAAVGLGSLAMFGSDASLIACLAIGFTIGAEFDLAAYLVSRYFGVTRFGATYGMLYALMALTSMLSTLAYGFTFQFTGSYRPGLQAASGALAVVVLLLMALPLFAGSGSESRRHGSGLRRMEEMP